MLREINLSFTKAGAARYTNQLHWENLFIGELFLYYLGKIKTGDCQKIIIDAVDRVEREIDDYEDAHSINLVVYFIQFDFDKYDSLDRNERKKYLAAFLYHGLLKVFAYKHWDPSPLEAAYNQVIDSDVVFRKILKERIRDPRDKSRVFQMLIEWESGLLECSILLLDAKSGIEIKRKKVFTIKSTSYMRSWKLSISKEKDILILSSTRTFEKFETSAVLD